MKVKNFALSLVLATLALSSCIREDRSDCYSSNILTLSYKGDGATEIFRDKISSVDMYVFDAAVQCVLAKNLSATEIAQQEVLLPRLAEGDYRVICIGNTANTQCVGIESAIYSSMYFADKTHIQGKTTATNDALYWASKNFTVTAKDATHSVAFASSHYDVYVEVLGLSKEGALPIIEMTNLSPRTTMDDNKAMGSPQNYTPAVTRHQEEKFALTNFNIMRHTNHHDVDVVVRSSSGDNELARVNLAEFLADNPEIDCSLHEVIIPISFAFSDKSAEVIIGLPNWYVQNVNPEF